jgi:hypothetical protein
LGLLALALKSRIPFMPFARNTVKWTLRCGQVNSS